MPKKATTVHLIARFEEESRIGTTPVGRRGDDTFVVNCASPREVDRPVRLELDRAEAEELRASLDKMLAAPRNVRRVYPERD